MKLVTAEQMRELERMAEQKGISEEQMMERAGSGLSAILQREAERLELTPRIVFLCGNGNNGGDAFAAARLLAEQGCAVAVCLVCGIPKTITSYAMYKRLKETNAVLTTSVREAAAAIHAANIVVDAVYGIGFHGELRQDLQTLYRLAEEKHVVAVDVPSGGNIATGAIAEGACHADATVTFGACKIGLVQYPLKEYCGKLYVSDIGIQAEMFEKLDYKMQVILDTNVKGMLPKRHPNTHKGNYGRLLCVAGSAWMPGAVLMALKAAQRCGVGLLTAATPVSVIHSIASSVPEVTYLPTKTDGSGYICADNADLILENTQWASVLLLGCGLGVTDETKALVHRLLREADCPIILDADGINCIVDCIDIIKEVKHSIVLTPHAGEMARLLKCPADEIQNNRLEVARKLAAEYHAVVVLKGAGTIVATESHAYVNLTGNSGMSKGGSGDILAGMIASLVAQGVQPDQAAALSVYMHGLAGDCSATQYTEYSMLPTDLLDDIPGIFLKLEQLPNPV